MVRRRTDKGAFASTGLVALVVRALQASDPGLLPQGTVSPDPMKLAILQAAAKRDLLEHVYRQRGAGPLLTVGQHLDLAGDAPTLAVLGRAGEATILADKWMRLERYYHAANRTVITSADATALECRRYALAGAPTPAENALIAGLLVGLCARAGGSRMSLSVDGTARSPADFARMGPFGAGGGAEFRIAWQAWRSPGDRGLPTKADATALPIRDRLRAVLAQDLGRTWRIAEAARKLAMSVRALQRDLAGNGCSFSSVLREARLHEGAIMLADSDTPLAEIGYCCGYADQAHFQRDFMRGLNITPAEYRRISSS